jgi:periplasmic divalent cation tolerance protein
MADVPDTLVLHLTTTVTGEADARHLATELVAQRLAACVQLDHVESHYRWEGAPCAEREVRLTVKSRPARLDALQAFFAKRHPYRLPQLLWHLEEATPAYAAWVRQEAGEQPGA